VPGKAERPAAIHALTSEKNFSQCRTIPEWSSKGYAMIGFVNAATMTTGVTFEGEVKAS